MANTLMHSWFPRFMMSSNEAPRVSILDFFGSLALKSLEPLLKSPGNIACEVEEVHLKMLSFFLFLFSIWNTYLDCDDDSLSHRRKKKSIFLRDLFYKFQFFGTLFTGFSAVVYYVRVALSLTNFSPFKILLHSALFILSLLFYILWAIARYQLGQ